MSPRTQTRWPPVQVVPFGSDWMVRCSECGDVQQAHSEEPGRRTAWEHQRWTHPTDEEREQDELVSFEHSQEMDGYCERCGVRGHRGRDCPTITPDLLKGDT